MRKPARRDTHSDDGGQGVLVILAVPGVPLDLDALVVGFLRPLRGVICNNTVPLNKRQKRE